MLVEIYSKPNCDFCEKAKNLLTKKNILYIEIDAPSNLDILKNRLKEAGKPPPKTVPQIFIDNQHVGGYTELEQYLK